MFYFLLVSPIFLMMFSVGFVQFKMYSLHAIDFILFPELPVVVLSNWMIMSELLLTNVIYHWTCRVHGLAARPLLMNFLCISTASGPAATVKLVNWRCLKKPFYRQTQVRFVIMWSASHLLVLLSCTGSNE